MGLVGAASTRRLRFTILRDGTAWTGIDSVTLTFDPSSGDAFDRDAILEATNVWYYDLTVDDLDSNGVCRVCLRITDGAVDVTYPYEITLEVVGCPAS